MKNFKVALAALPLFLLATLPGSLLLGLSLAFTTWTAVGLGLKGLAIATAIGAALGVLVGLLSYFQTASMYWELPKYGAAGERANNGNHDNWESDWRGGAHASALMGAGAMGAGAMGAGLLSGDGSDGLLTPAFNIDGAPMMPGGVDINGHVFGQTDSPDTFSSTHDTLDSGIGFDSQDFGTVHDYSPHEF